jgi:hypothetical protein
MLRLPTVVLAAVALLGVGAASASAAPVDRATPKILSASWGTDNLAACPNGVKGLDNIPVTFNWFIEGSTIQPSDFQIVRSDGSVVTPTCALQFPPDEADEAQTVNLIGDFGDAVNGPTPATVKVVGDLSGHPPLAQQWKPIAPGLEAPVNPIAGGPFIVDAWTLTPKVYAGDRNPCTVGKTFVRVMWSNGLTAYPTGQEVDAPVLASYRALYRLRGGKVVAIKPLGLGDLHDQASTFNSDNMHDLCLPQVPRGARLVGVTIGPNLIQDPNGDPNEAQRYTSTR